MNAAIKQQTEEPLYHPQAFYTWLNSADANRADRWCVAWLAMLRVPGRELPRFTVAKYKQLARAWREKIIPSCKPAKRKKRAK